MAVTSSKKDIMADQKPVYITLVWQEQGPQEVAGYRLWRQERKVYASSEYPGQLPCSNPHCKNGGFNIGDRIAVLLASGQNSEQNSLICHNAIHPDRTKRCLHVIAYTITCVRPYQRGDGSHRRQSQKKPLLSSFREIDN